MFSLFDPLFGRQTLICLFYIEFAIIINYSVSTMCYLSLINLSSNVLAAILLLCLLSLNFILKVSCQPLTDNDDHYKSLNTSMSLLSLTLCSCLISMSSISQSNSYKLLVLMFSANILGLYSYFSCIQIYVKQIIIFE